MCAVQLIEDDNFVSLNKLGKKAIDLLSVVLIVVI